MYQVILRILRLHTTPFRLHLDIRKSRTIIGQMPSIETQISLLNAKQKGLQKGKGRKIIEHISDHLEGGKGNSEGDIEQMNLKRQ